jgi:uncharacterized protein (UPF0332 family)
MGKARESLASCEADIADGRFNSAANRAYYAAFQAGVAALIHECIRPETGNWQHRFVLSQFFGKLLRRHEGLASDLPGVMDVLFRTRIKADYEPDAVSARQAQRSAQGAASIVTEVEGMTRLTSFREASADYDPEYRQGQTTVAEAESFVAELEDTILTAVRSAHFSVSRLGPTDYRIYAYVESEDDIDRVHDALGGSTIDILTDHDIWIVVLPTVRDSAGT